jgi:hypothetical protein
MLAAHTAAEAGHTEAVAVAPIDLVVGMAVDRIVVEVVVGSIDSAVVPDLGMETLVIGGSQETEAVGLGEGEVVCYTPVAPEGMVMKAHHMVLG